MTTFHESSPPRQLNNRNDVGDLIYRLKANKNEPHLQEALSSSSQRFKNRDLATIYFDLERSQSATDFRNELFRLQHLQHIHHNESLISLTDSEIFDGNQYESQQLLQTYCTPTASSKDHVIMNLTCFGRFLEILSHLPLPRMSVTGMGILFLIAVFICPRTFGENLLFPSFRLLFGTLYPAYSSYKAVRTKNVKEYVKWMMYWIVYAFFTCIETFTDIFLSWFPFYYEVKVIIVIWLLSPATKGSSTLYRKFVHPMLTRREQEIDEYLNQAKEKGYTAVLQLGSKGVNYATNVIMQTALKGGGNLMQSIRRSYSLSDLSEPDIHRAQDEVDELTKTQRFLRSRNQNVRSSSGNRHSEMYFSEVDVGEKAPVPNYNYIRSTEDISSGYSSAEPVSGGLSRTSSMTNATRPRFKAKRAEGEGIYLKSDEYEAMRELPVPSSFSNYPSQILFYQNYLHPSPLSMQFAATNENDENSFRVSNSNLNDLRNEIFLENEKYFQNLKQSEAINVEPIISAKTLYEEEQLKDAELKNIPEDMKEKYEMFCNWLQTASAKQDKPLKIDVRRQTSDEDYEDTISGESEGEETFVDTESNVEDIRKPENESAPVLNETNSDLEVKATTESVKSEDCILKENLQQQETLKIDCFSKVIIKADSTCSSDSENKTPEIQAQNFSSFVANLITDNSRKEDNVRSPQSNEISSSNSYHNLDNPNLESLKKPAFHSKGKAPIPPELLLKSTEKFESSTMASVPPLPPKKLDSEATESSKTSQIYSTESSLPKPLKHFDDLTHHYPVSDLSSVPPPPPHSRSPSPSPSKSDVKKMTKKSIFKNYLPSLFRTESSKPNNVNLSNPSVPSSFENLPKETQI